MFYAENLVQTKRTLFGFGLTFRQFHYFLRFFFWKTLFLKEFLNFELGFLIWQHYGLSSTTHTSLLQHGLLRLNSFLHLHFRLREADDDVAADEHPVDIDDPVQPISASSSPALSLIPTIKEVTTKNEQKNLSFTNVSNTSYKCFHCLA